MMSSLIRLFGLQLNTVSKTAGGRDGGARCCRNACGHHPAPLPYSWLHNACGHHPVPLDTTQPHLATTVVYQLRQFPSSAGCDHWWHPWRIRRLAPVPLQCRHHNIPQQPRNAVNHVIFRLGAFDHFFPAGPSVWHIIAEHHCIILCHFGCREFLCNPRHHQWTFPPCCATQAGRLRFWQQAHTLSLPVHALPVNRAGIHRESNPEC